MIYYIFALSTIHRIRSARVKRSNKLNQLKFAFILYLLLLHTKIVIISVIGIDNHHIQTANNPNLRIGFDIVIRPFLELSLLGEYLWLVHNLLEEALVLSNSLDLATLGVLDQFQDVVAINDNLLLLLPRHVVS